MLFVNKNIKFEVAPYKPGTQDYELWWWKEQYVKGLVDVEQLEYRIELVLKRPPGTLPEPGGLPPAKKDDDLIQIVKTWQ